MDKKIVILITSAILLALLGAFFLMSRGNESEETTTPTQVPAVATQTSELNSNPQPTAVTINSRKLAANYFVYEKSEYEKTKAANRPILLFFYANWCPTCARQEPINVATFNNLGATDLIAFRVNYNDTDTSSDEDHLAKEFGIPYQHHFRLFDSSGKLVDSFQGDTSESQLKERISKVN